MLKLEENPKKMVKELEERILKELDTWDLSCSEEPTLKLELAKALSRTIQPLQQENKQLKGMLEARMLTVRNKDPMQARIRKLEEVIRKFIKLTDEADLLSKGDFMTIGSEIQDIRKEAKSLLKH